MLVDDTAAVALGEGDGTGFIVVFVVHLPAVREALVGDAVAVVVGVFYRLCAARVRDLCDPAVLSVFVGVDCARWNSDGGNFVSVVGEV